MNTNNTGKDTTIGMYLLKRVYNDNERNNTDIFDAIDSLDMALFNVKDIKLAERWQKALIKLEPEYLKLYLEYIIQMIEQSPEDVSFIWVKGHSGDTVNELCDKLATGAAKNGPFLDDVTGGDK